ncbi:hypothetical protein ACFVYD_13220 [Streptomyces sp. NPDC058301]|uniref:hypothetical protein n=1 Tax=Streptomyces sp. NPDC058301 TaxID=3346436 RepID=UPI0036ECB21B
MLAGPLPGIYDPVGLGKLLFASFAATAETERELGAQLARSPEVRLRAAVTGPTI